MVNTLRRFSQPIMILVAVVVVITFVWWQPSFNARTGEDAPVGTVYGKPMSQATLSRFQRRAMIHQMLQGEYAQTLMQTAMQLSRGDRDKMNVHAALTCVVLDNEIEALGIGVTDEEIKDQLVNRTPAFHGADGRFDQGVYENFVKTQLTPSGFSQAQIEEFIINEVRVRKLRELTGFGVTATPEEVNDRALKQTLQTEASYAAIKLLDVRKDLKATDEELKQAYEAKKAGLKSEETRKVRYAAFRIPPPPEGKPYEEQKRAELQQGLANRAYELRSELEEAGPAANFEELAKKHGATYGVTAEFFDASNAPDEIEDEEVIAEAAFMLTKEKPFSGTLSAAQGLEKGAYVLAFHEVKAPETLTFEAAKSKVQDEFLMERAVKLLSDKAADVSKKVEEAKKAGKTFVEAAEAGGIKAIQVPAFKGAAAPATEYAQIIGEVAGKLAPGEMSRAIPAGTDYVIVHVDSRVADEKAIAAAKESAKNMIEMRGKYSSFTSWLLGRRAASGVAAIRIE